MRHVAKQDTEEIRAIYDGYWGKIIGYERRIVHWQLHPTKGWKARRSSWQPYDPFALKNRLRQMWKSWWSRRRG